MRPVSPWPPEENRKDTRAKVSHYPIIHKWISLMGLGIQTLNKNVNQPKAKAHWKDDLPQSDLLNTRNGRTVCHMQISRHVTPQKRMMGKICAVISKDAEVEPCKLHDRNAETRKNRKNVPQHNTCNL